MARQDHENFDRSKPNAWAGTQSDKFETTSDMKPQYPPCDNPNQRQFAEVLPNPEFGNKDNYIKAKFDVDNNLVPERRPFDHAEMPMEKGRAGTFQFTDSDLTGDARMAQNNVIEYGTGAAFGRAETAWSDTSKSDRGRES
jgi:hypothetical protein